MTQFFAVVLLCVTSVFVLSACEQAEQPACMVEQKMVEAISHSQPTPVIAPNYTEKEGGC
jgi:hypothetical protein